VYRFSRFKRQHLSLFLNFFCGPFQKTPDDESKENRCYCVYCAGLVHRRGWCGPTSNFHTKFYGQRLQPDCVHERATRGKDLLRCGIRSGTGWNSGLLPELRRQNDVESADELSHYFCLWFPCLFFKSWSKDAHWTHAGVGESRSLKWYAQRVFAQKFWHFFSVW